jgi:hypothetical protein
MRSISDDSGSAPDSPSGSGMFNELSSLIPIRLRHQSEEEASAVRVAHTRNTQANAGDLNSAGDKSEAPYPHNPKAAASQDSERWQLLKKINEIVGNSAESAQGESMGLNRCNWWTTEKVAAGSSIHATSSHTTSGNIANAQAAACKSAQIVSSLVFLAFPGNI